MTPIRFSSYTPYRWFSHYWCREVLWYVVGLRMSAHSDESMQWAMPGWCRDLYTFYHRGRYGWAPRDVWDMNNYLNGVIGHMLRHLAENSMSAPSAHTNNDSDGYDTWKSDLETWSRAFLDLQAWNDHGEQDAFDSGADWSTIRDMEQRKYAAVERALKEMAPWWGALWD